nr:TVP38/TMEM64 family protein [Prochlorothrix hollandica]
MTRLVILPGDRPTPAPLSSPRVWLRALAPGLRRSIPFFGWFMVSFWLMTLPTLAQGVEPDTAGNVLQSLQQGLVTALSTIQDLGPIGPLVFMALYVVATVAFLPGSILTLGAGVVFGVVGGALYVFVGATLGATAAFLVGRYLARGWVAEKIDGNAQFKAIDTAVGREGFKIVLLTRLSPVFPFNVLNYAYGLTGVSLRDYVLGSVGMVPGTVMYVYLGSLAGSLATLGAGDAPSNPTVTWALRLIGLVATVAVTFYITAIAKKALQNSVQED